MCWCDCACHFMCMNLKFAHYSVHGKNTKAIVSEADNNLRCYGLNKRFTLKECATL